jgi:hypothetical protein
LFYIYFNLTIPRRTKYYFVLGDLDRQIKSNVIQFLLENALER